VSGFTTAFTTVIGLEVHVQLRTASKLFSPAPVDALGEPNTRVDAIDLGLPGVLPQPNAHAIALATRAALALGADVQPTSRFCRKHYFYPDLPKGYQISQFHAPLAFGGSVPLGDGRACRLHHLHVEEDAGKLVHTDLGTLVDLNRAGVPLVEIVGEPDLRAPAEAYAFLAHLRHLLRFCGISDCDLELGSMRCDANISLMPVGSATFGTKVELKNLNSLKMVQRALEYEERRQTAVLAAGGKVAAETRGWHDELGESRLQRSKEQAPDYRYLPDPDLPELRLAAAFIDEQVVALGELPSARRERYAQQFGLSPTDLDALLAERSIGDWFERVVAGGADGKLACNWLVADVLPGLRERGESLEQSQLGPKQLAALLAMLAQKQLTHVNARAVVKHLLALGGEPTLALRQLGLDRIADPALLLPLVEAAIEALPEAAAAVRAGKDKALDALVGNVMRAVKGRADPDVTKALFRAGLGLPHD
jgi:aspartyl-tRNA(Asn)/glutamyl-tRNA(Gln) amidotransferase subunit B